MFLYLFSLAVIIFEVICCQIFFGSFCVLPLEKRKIQKIFLTVLLIIAYYTCGLTLSNRIVVKQIIAILVTTIIMRHYLEISLKKSAVIALLYQGLLLVVDYLAYIGNTAIISKEGTVQREYALEGNLVVAFSKIILFFCVLLIQKKFGKKSTEMLEDTEWIRFLLFPIFTIGTILSMLMTFKYTENELQVYTLYSIAFGMLVMNLYVYYLINDIVIREAKLREKEIAELHVKNQIEMYRSVSENYEIQKRKSHEFKNHILCIESLLKDCKYDDVDRYVHNITRIFMGERNVINTNHVIINAILNTKYHEAISKRIVFVFKVTDLSAIWIDDEDLVVVLANLLNNAIEACEKCEEKKIIKFKFVIENEWMILSVKNTYNQPILYDYDEIKTSKTITPEEHGIGIKNVIQIVEKYKGEYVIQNDEKEFYFSIVIPVKK